MQTSFALLRYSRHLKRFFTGQGTLQSAAYRQDVLCPEEKATYQPAIYLDGQLERVTSSSVESTKEIEIDSATKLTGRHGATIAYHFKNVALIDGSIYGGNLRFFVADPKQFKSAERRDMERAALVSSYYGSKYFGHWLRDDCTLHCLADELSIPSLCLPSLAGPHVDDYKSLLKQDWTPTVRGHFKHLTIFGDYYENSLKLARYETLRGLVSAKFPLKSGRSFVYLKRGKQGAPRKIQNEDQIVEALVRNGFVVVDSEWACETLLDILVNAKIVISLEGSHISHCVYAIPNDCSLLVLQPPDRFAANHRLWSNCLGIRYGFVVGTIGVAGYQFDTTEILRTLDLISAET